MQENNNIEIRSEEVQEILGTPPGWLVRWGTIMALVTLVVLGWVGYWVRYPEIVKSNITITSSEPPKRLVPGIRGQSQIERILVNNEDTVEAEQTLLVFSSKAKFEDVLTLETSILQVKVLTDSALLAFRAPDDLILGNLQEVLYNFNEKQSKLRLTKSPKYENLSIRQLQKELSRNQNSIQYEERKKENLAEQIDLVYERLVREERLFKENALSYNSLRSTREELLALEREMQSIESAMKSKEFEIESIRNQIRGIKQGSQEDQITASIELKDAFYQLKNRVEEWKSKYLLVSPIHGIVLFPTDLTEEQYVPDDKELMVVVPIQRSEIVGKIDLKLDGSGRVKEGQKVIVKLKSYPFAEFGALEGTIKWKGRLPSGTTIPVEVNFPKGLITTTGRSIEPTREMTGDAEIITEDKRFIERIFENFREMTS